MKEFGYQGNEQDLSLFRQGLSMYPEDKELQEIPYYNKYNRARDGYLKVGDTVEDVVLSDKDCKEKTSLFSFYEQRRQALELGAEASLVVVAGSIS